MLDFVLEHWLLSILGTIVLGAIGSGLWDVALRPVAKKIGSLVFTLLTFGAKSARDRIYKRAASGHHDVPALHMLSALAAIVIVLAIASSTIAISMGIMEEQFAEECDSVGEPQGQRSCFREKVRTEIGNALNVPTRYIPLQYWSLFIIFIAVVIIYEILTITKINSIITYFQQCLRALGPALSAENRLRLEQAFALMESKESFEALIKELNDTAKANGVRLPKSYF